MRCRTFEMCGPSFIAVGSSRSLRSLDEFLGFASKRRPRRPNEHRQPGAALSGLSHSASSSQTNHVLRHWVANLENPASDPGRNTARRRAETEQTARQISSGQIQTTPNQTTTTRTKHPPKYQAVPVRTTTRPRNQNQDIGHQSSRSAAGLQGQVQTHFGAGEFLRLEPRTSKQPTRRSERPMHCARRVVSSAETCLE